MDSPSQTSAAPPTSRRGGTTALGSVILTMAGVGFLGSSFILLSAIFGGKTSAVPHSILLMNSALSVLSKVGLLVLGIFLIRRHSYVRAVAAVGLAFSLIDSAYYLA